MRVLQFPSAVGLRAVALPFLFGPVFGTVLALGACNAGTAAPPTAKASSSLAQPGAAPLAAAPAQPSTVSPGATAAPAAAAVAPAAAASVKPLAFGAAFEPGPVVSLSALLANPSAYAEQGIITEGHVQRACSRRGCWMEIGEGEAACRVTFKDYGFFVPTDSAGSHARLQGKLSTKEIPAAQVAHLESEGARFAHRRPDGSATEVQLIASAVELTR